MSYETAAQLAIFAALDGNISGLTIYDDVPMLPDGTPDANFPYAVIGDDTLNAWDTDDKTGAKISVYIHFWSRYAGMSEVKAKMGLAYDLLHRARLTAAGYNVIDILREFSDVSVDPDGKTRHGVQRYILTIQEN